MIGGKGGLGRRGLLIGAGAWGMAASAAQADAGALQALAGAAAGEAPITWYESSPPDQLDRIVQAYAARFPGLRVRAVRVVGGIEIAGRLLNEAQAGGAGADVATGGTAEGIWSLHDRGLLATADWRALGVPAGIVVQPFALAMAATAHVIVYNTRLVGAAAVPRGWDDLTDPRWAGKFGTWIGPHAYTSLAAIWGEPRADAYVERIAALRPQLFRSQFTLGQAVAAGEIELGVSSHHTLLPALAAGAPIGVVVPDPASITSIHSYVLAGSRSPNAARLFAGWLATPEGVMAYEDATGRGSPVIPETRIARLLSGRQIAEFPMTERVPHYYAMLARHTAMLRNGGRDAG